MAIRLIDTRSLDFVFFMGKQTPQYAILSHTWMGEELTFQEMIAASKDVDHPARSKSGYDKITKTCELARKNGIDYAWVDTCCIDKTSSAELSEAINTMYAWYQKAKICYAILSDFEPQESVSETSLGKCRWFSRGWCLQELIAPSNMDFLNAEWKKIGTRASLAPLLSKITRIQEDVLLNNSLVSTVPIACRMSWAATRETTREEDAAYCLLGIFNVNMPMLYGEGSRAFTRLQHEIIRMSNDLSIFATLEESISSSQDSPSKQPNLFCSLFAESPKEFTACGSIVHTGSNVQWNDVYSITNKGLQLRKVVLQVHLQEGLYSILLKCKFAGRKPIRMFLRKVGPGLYARVNERHVDFAVNNSDTDSCENYPSKVEEEIYVITNVEPEMLSHLTGADEYAIQVQSNHLDLHRALQVFQRAASSERWDPSRMMFLTKDESSFQGSWKVFPNFMQEKPSGGDDALRALIVGQPAREVFYLTCRLVQLDEGSAPQASVRLLSLSQWLALDKKFGINSGSSDADDSLGPRTSKDEFKLKTGPDTFILVTATIDLQMELGKQIFKLVLDLNRT